MFLTCVNIDSSTHYCNPSPFWFSKSLTELLFTSESCLQTRTHASSILQFKTRYYLKFKTRYRSTVSNIQFKKNHITGFRWNQYLTPHPQFIYRHLDFIMKYSGRGIRSVQHTSWSRYPNTPRLYSWVVLLHMTLTQACITWEHSQ